VSPFYHGGVTLEELTAVQADFLGTFEHQHVLLSAQEQLNIFA
jgi:hypothetical protein